MKVFVKERQEELKAEKLRQEAVEILKMELAEKRMAAELADKMICCRTRS